MELLSGLQASSELSTGMAGSQLPVYAQHLGQERSLMFSSRWAVFSPRQHYRKSSSLNTQVSDCRYIFQSSDFISSKKPSETWGKSPEILIDPFFPRFVRSDSALSFSLNVFNNSDVVFLAKVSIWRWKNSFLLDVFPSKHDQNAWAG